MMKIQAVKRTIGKIALWLRFYLAFLAARLVAFGCRITGRPGTSLPGVAALKIFPGLVRFLAPGYERVLAVTGTNGKTTTANLLAHVLRKAGVRVAHNAEGANMLPGAAAALLRDCDWLGRPRSRVALLEVDEGSVGKVFAAARPEIVIVTNYFRDQLDRYWELERTTALLRSAVAELPGATLILNADDPLAAAVGRGHPRARCFGVLRDAAPEPGAGSGSGEGRGADSGETREARFCLFCGAALQYRYYHYGQLGDYFCPGCGFRRPDLSFAAAGVSAGDVLAFTLHYQPPASPSLPPQGGASILLKAPLRGFYNVYNVLGAAAAALTLGVPAADLKAALLDYTPAPGRMEEFLFAGRPCTLALIKNPAGVNEVLKTILARETEKALVIAINDLAADGRDVSWLWDADFARLTGARLKKIICAGRRAADLAVCLKYAGIDPGRLALAPDRAASLRMLAQEAPGAEELYVLATYTNLFPYAGLLRRRGRRVEKGAAQGLPSLP